MFTAGSELHGTVRVTDLEAGERVTVRIDTLLACKPGTSPTGNLQGQLDSGKVVGSNDVINTGQQTIPFLKVGELAGAGEPMLTIEKSVVAAGSACPGDDLPLSVTAGMSVKYCYIVSNPGTYPLYDLTLTDDNGTPGTTADDFAVTLAGLQNLDGQSDALDLASGTSATGSAVITFRVAGEITNIATARGNNGLNGGNAKVLTDSDTATVSVAGVPNSAPVANADSATTAEDTAVTINVAGNDSDVDGNLVPSSVSIIDTPGNGSVKVNGDGTVTYTPYSDYNGTDTFTYRICDAEGTLCASAVVTVNVTAVNDAPVAVDDSGTTPEDMPVTVKVLSNDSDVDGDTLAVTGVTQPAHGTVVVNPDGSVTYTPAPNYNGPDQFSYQVSDGKGGTDTAVVDIVVTPVNDAPVANPDAATVAEDTAAVINILGNDSDPDGDKLTLDSVSQPAHGTVMVNGDGTVTYTPDANYNGPDSFTYTVCDPSGACATTTVTVNVTPVNDPPVARNDSYVTAQDTVLRVPAAGVLVNDSDPIEGSSVSVSGYNATSTFGGTVVMNADGSFSYTPAQSFAGYDTFTYTITDGQGGTATATVTIEVTAKNGRSIAVSWGDWNLGGSNLSGAFLVQNMSGPYAVQLNSYQIQVQYRTSGQWVNVAANNCSFSPAAPTLLMDKVTVSFAGCTLMAPIPAGSTVRVTAVVEIYGHKDKGQQKQYFLARLSKQY